MNKYLLFFLAITILISSCSKDDAVILPESALNAYEIRVIDYFIEIALGFELGGATEITRRWVTNMKIYVGGTASSVLLLELDKIIGEINELSTTGFIIETVIDSLDSNYYIFFGSGNSYADIFPSLSNLVESNWGLFTISWNGLNEINKGKMYVDIFRANETEQKHLLREELTQSLGLGKDSPRYSDSIFQQAFSTKTTEYAQIDRDLIRLLYHPVMRIGLTKNQVDVVLTDILVSEK